MQCMELLFPIIEFVAVSLLLLGAFRLRNKLGLSAVIAVVASLQFVQAVLGNQFFWRIGPEFTYSPGSSILFAGNLAILLVAFELEGADSARQILYGIIIANVANSVVGVVLDLHISAVPPVGGTDLPTEIFYNGAYSAIAGIVVLYVDQLLAILLFASLRQRWKKLSVVVPLTTTLVVILAFDTLAYMPLLFGTASNLFELVLGGLASKSVGGLAFGLVWGLYLEASQKLERDSVEDVLDILLFRENIDVLREAAVRDDLTGLYNRRSYNMIIEQLLEQEKNGPGEKFALILCDVDNFKQVNDVLGHAAGDRVLVDIAEAIQSAIREADFSFRFGGDEFMILLPNCGTKQAGEVAQRLLDYRYSHPKLDEPVTLTTGIAEHPKDGQTAKELFVKADRDLYRGKE